MTITTSITSLVEAQHVFFLTHQTRSNRFCETMFLKLKQATLKHEKTLVESLWNDLHRSYEEAFLNEFSTVLSEIDLYIKRIINKKAFDRLVELLLKGKIIYSGTYDADERYIAPIIINEITSDTIMQQEIFVPLLPVMTFKNSDEVVRFLNNCPKPLAFYYFGTNQNAKEILAITASGDTCINDIIYYAFGKRKSAVWRCWKQRHGEIGKYSFEAFSNQRVVLIALRNSDLPIRHMPYKYFLFVKKLLKK